MARFDSAKRVMSGSWGELWFDGDLVSEVHKSQAKVTHTKKPTARNGARGIDTKVTSYKGTGSVGMHKVNSRMIHLIAENIRNGHDVRFTFIGKLSDPDAYGSERIRFKNVSLDELTLMDWENDQAGTIESPFTFTDYDVLDTVDASYE